MIIDVLLSVGYVALVLWGFLLSHRIDVLERESDDERIVTRHVEEREIRYAIAQAWCTEGSSHKVFDPAIAEAVTKNIVLLLKQRGIHAEFPHD